MASGRKGMTSTTSVIRMSVASAHPPARIATTRTAVPKVIAVLAAIRPIRSDTRVPQRTSEKMSCPMSLVPSQCSTLAGEKALPVTSRGSWGASAGPKAAMNNMVARSVVARSVVPTTAAGVPNRIPVNRSRTTLTPEPAGRVDRATDRPRPTPRWRRSR